MSLERDSTLLGQVKENPEAVPLYLETPVICPCFEIHWNLFLMLEMAHEANRFVPICSNKY